MTPWIVLAGRSSAIYIGDVDHPYLNDGSERLLYAVSASVLRM